MIRIVLIFFVLLWAVNLTAQKINPDTLSIEQAYQYRDDAIKMRNAGKTLTLCGTGVLVTGITAGVIMMNTPVPGQEPDDPYIDSSNLMKGIFIIGLSSLVGIASNAVGIPLWVVGGKRMAGAEIAIKQFGYRTTYSMPVGLGITIRF
jgi:hypothetical protein